MFMTAAFVKWESGCSFLQNSLRIRIQVVAGPQNWYWLVLNYFISPWRFSSYKELPSKLPVLKIINFTTFSVPIWLSWTRISSACPYGSVFEAMSRTKFDLIMRWENYVNFSLTCTFVLICLERYGSVIISVLQVRVTPLHNLIECLNLIAYPKVCRWFRFAQLAKGKKFRP